MKIMNKVTAVVLGLSLTLLGGVALADSTKEEATQEQSDDQENARGIEKSDIKRGMDIKKPKAQQAGDPIPGIDITVNQGHSVCQAGSDCDDDSAPQKPGVSQKGGAKFKAGKALADTVKKVDDGGDDVDHVDEDSDDDGLLDQ